MLDHKLYTKKELHEKFPGFYTKRGLLTRYGFSCGYVEERKGLSLSMEHGVYHVKGFRHGKPQGVTFNGNRDISPIMTKPEGEYHITGSFAHVKEARKFMANPFSHIPSSDGSVTLTLKTAGLF